MKILTVKGSQGLLFHLASETVTALLLAKLHSQGFPLHEPRHALDSTKLWGVFRRSYDLFRMENKTGVGG